METIADCINRGARETVAAQKSPTMELIDRLGDELAAQGPLFPDIPREEILPGVTHYGRVYDQKLYTAAWLERQEARRQP